jgi:hypothetical protein
MFLIRMAFWLVVIIMLLPTSKDQQSQVMGTAEAAVKDVSGFCQRNPDVCVKGQGMFQVFMQKAEFGANMVMGFVQEQAGKQLAADHGAPMTADPVANAQPYSAPAPQPKVYDTNSQNTLTPRDLQPAWHAPSGT